MTRCIVDDSPRDLVFERLFDAIAAAKSSGETTLYAVLKAVLEAREAGEIGRVQAALNAIHDTGARPVR